MRISRAAKLMLAAGALAVIVCVQQPVCFSCCHAGAARQTSYASSSCCDEQCGDTALEKGKGGTCLLSAGSAAGRHSTPALRERVFQVLPPAELRSASVFLAPSPPRIPAPTTLRL